MNIFFAFSISKNTFNLNDLLQPMADKLNLYFRDKKYSKTIDKVYYGIICVDPKFDSFFKPRRMFFSEKNGFIEFELKLNFKMSELSEEELIKIVANNILEKSTKLSRKKKIFNYDEYIKDLETALQGYL